MHKETFLTALSKLSIAFGVELTDPLLDVYWEDLGHLDGGLFSRACAQARRDWDKPFALPTINFLLKKIDQEGVRSGGIMDGDAAWVALRKRVLASYAPGVVRHTPLDWPDDLTRTIVRDDLGGIYAVAVTEGERALDNLRRRFVALYNERRPLGFAAPALASGDRRVDVS